MWGGGSRSDVVGQKWQVPKEARAEVGGGVAGTSGQMQIKRYNNRSEVEGKAGTIRKRWQVKGGWQVRFYKSTATGQLWPV